jgi:cytosine/adenosine deaminase-related metal-dependent hydrolase
MELSTYLIEIEGEVTVKKGIFYSDSLLFEEKDLDTPDFVLMPAFFNSHVHLSDSVAIDPPEMPLEKMVGPNGYKFRVLSSASENEIVTSTSESIELARSSGTAFLCDFREGGLKGVDTLRKADGSEIVVCMARPSSLEEAEKMVDSVNGFGMSSVRDHDFVFLEDVRELARKNNLLFGIHAGERDDGDVEKAISLEPDFLVHMNNASKDNIMRAIDEEIPVISCIRSNYLFNLHNRESYSILSEYELWGLGTDNVMLVKPSMVDEINFAGFIVNYISVLRSSSKGFDIFEKDRKWILADFRKYRKSRNVLKTIVRRLSEKDILKIIDDFEIM